SDIYTLSLHDALPIFASDLMGIEIAVGALLHAPGNVDVEGERRELREPHTGRRCRDDDAHGWTPSFSLASSRRSALPRWLTRFRSEEHTSELQSLAYL